MDLFGLEVKGFPLLLWGQKKTDKTREVMAHSVGVWALMHVTV